MRASRCGAWALGTGFEVVALGLWAQAQGLWPAGSVGTGFRGVALGLWAQAQELWCLIALQHVGFFPDQD